MNNVLMQRVASVLCLSWLTGPIFDKELRVSSRRRRNYVLRCVHIIFFTLLVSLIWVERVRSSTISVYQTSRMGEAGQTIIVFVVWFQFVAAQIVAIVMLSTAISDEIYNKTLGLLMTTPVGSLQIVLGKLLSKLLQLMLLLGITLPLLAIVRVFGGVPWTLLVCGFCVTLTTAIFLASLSLFFSIFTRRAYAVIIEAVVVAGMLFAVLPVLATLTLRERVDPQKIMVAMSYVNPYVVLIEATEGLMTARATSQLNWPAHCGVMLGGSAFLLLLSSLFVRKVALRQATGQPVLSGGRKKGKKASGRASAGRLRRVMGPPVFWKERRAPYFGRLSVGRVILGLLAAGFLALTYAICIRENALDDPDTHVFYAIIFGGLGIIFTAILPATCITAEKESRSWPILLTTTVGSGAILWGKFLGSVRRCSAVWLLLIAHVGVFVAVGIIHPIALVQFGIFVIWMMFFLCGTGLYFSMRFKRTTTAVIANVALAVFLWGLLPLLLVLVLAITRTGDNMLEVYVDFNPCVHLFVIAEATAHGKIGNYDWAQGSMHEPAAAMAWMLFNAVIYSAAGAFFLTLAWARLRRDPV